MKKNFLRWFGGVLAALALGVHAERVTPEMAMNAANAWVRKNAAFGAAGQATGVLAVSNAAQTAALWYQVSMSNGGMLVVAPNTDVEPVVAALEKDPGVLPAAHPLRTLLTADIQRRLTFLGLVDAKANPSEARTRAVAARTPERSDVAEAWAEEQNAKWTKLMEGDSGMLRRAASVPPGVADVPVQIGIVDGFEAGGRFTHWNQSTKDGQKCYNYHTPSNAPCGCVATACAAVMQRFAVTGPKKPMENECSYNNGLKEMYTMKGGVYDWDILPTTYGGTNETTALSDAQRELLGRVVYDVGVGVGMAWGSEASAASLSSIVEVFKKAYGFKDARYVASPSPEQYAKLIYHQCAAGAPVLMSIHSESSGHAVVAVGYGRDADNVARTRVFLGWGGAGDAWYALPDIATQSVLGGTVEDFTILNGIVTMLGYDSDEVIPVVGQVVEQTTESEFEISVDGALETNGLPRTIVSTNGGYFATRVSPLVDPKTLTCRGNVATFEVGASSSSSSDADELDAALPDFINFALLNASVAYSMESAIEMALAEGKAVLRVSGTVGETNTESLIQYIYGLDRENVNDFTNRFVYYFASADAASGDGNPSYGIFLPQKVKAEDNWVASNGRLAYGFASASTTNIYNQAGDIVSSAEVVRVFTDFGGASNAWETVDGTNTGAIETSVQSSFQTVLETGWDAYLRQTSGISLTVTAVPNEVGEVNPVYGVYANIYTNGEVVTATCPAVVTNDAKTVEMSCTGWTLTNETTGVCKTGVVETASFPVASNTFSVVSNTFSVASNDVITLTWQFKTNRVYVSVLCAGGDKLGRVSPGTDWYDYGKPVIFTAVPNADGQFNGFSTGLPDDAVQAGYSVAWTVRESVMLTANFEPGSDNTVYKSTNTLTVLAFEVETGDDGEERYVELASTPPYRIAGVKGMEEPQMVSAGVPTNVPATKLLVSSSATTFTNGTAVTWRLVKTFEGELDEATSKLKMTSGETGNAALAVDLSMTNKVACFVWERETSSSGGGDTPDDPDAGDPEVPVGENGGSPLTIVANDDGTLTVQANIVNAKPGWWYTIISTDDLAGSWARVPAANLTETNNDSVKATEATVTLRITFASESAARFYKVKVTQDELRN